MDVVVPHTRCMSDMLEILDVLVHDDDQSRGDFWRQQPWVKLPKASQVRPNSYTTLAPGSLAGKRLGVPAMYINADEQAGSANSVGIGGPTGQKIKTRNSIMSLWEQAKYALRVAGAEVVVVDFPVVSNYEGDRDNVPNIQNRGILPDEFLYQEITDLSVWAWDDFLNSNSDPKLNRLSDVDGEKIFPAPEGALPDRYTGFADDIAEYPAFARRKPNLGLYDIPTLPKGLMGLEEIRRIDLEDWMDEKQLDAVIFPAVADVAPADADLNETSADIAWRNGVWVANGNLAIRHLGIPTVTVPMGTMDDIGMPVGLTFAGRAYSDNSLIELACAFEATGSYRSLPPSTS
jgi:amidase